jgi:predicted oxidoreductase
MHYEKIHPDGPIFPRMIAGVWRWHNVSATTFEKLIAVSLEEGIDAFDHADIYGDYSVEQLFGDVMRKNPSWRNRVKLITKCGIKLLSSKKPEHLVKHYDTSKSHILASVDQSLKNLSADRLELLLLHRPDPLMDAAAVAEAFMHLRQSGKVHHFGVSNFTTAQFALLQSFLSFPLVTNQVEISLFKHDLLVNGTLDYFYQRHTRLMAWSPLGGGKFSSHEMMASLSSLQHKYGASESQLLYAWLLRHPSMIFPVMGTTQPDRIREGVKALSIHLDRQDWFEMLRCVRQADVP